MRIRSVRPAGSATPRPSAGGLTGVSSFATSAASGPPVTAFQRAASVSARGVEAHELHGLGLDGLHPQGAGEPQDGVGLRAGRHGRVVRRGGDVQRRRTRPILT